MDRDDPYRSVRPTNSGWQPPRPSTPGWLRTFVLTIVLVDGIAAAAILLAPIRWFSPALAPWVERARLAVGLKPAPTPASTGSGGPASTGVAAARPPVSPAAAPTPPGRRSIRCLVDGAPVEIQGERCPPTRAASPVTPPAPRPTADAFVKPGTIYRCKAYSGGLFWSQTHCSQHKATIDRIASVPVGLPFQQQIELAAGDARQVEQSIQRERQQGERLNLCAALQHERDQIWKRSGSGAGYVAPDVLGRDQTRWQQIEPQLNANGCRRP